MLYLIEHMNEDEPAEKENVPEAKTMTVEICNMAQRNWMQTKEHLCFLQCTAII